MADTEIEWADASWNPTTGCDRVSAGCDNCLAPETRVLRSDMTWTPIGSVQVGDRLVSFTETPAVGENRVWEEALVEAVWETEQPTVEIELANGARITASEDHRWLLAQRGASNWWRSTIKLNFTTQLRTLSCKPIDTSREGYQAGYIAGATAGDGTFRWNPEWRSSSTGYPQTYWRIAKLADDRIMLDRLVNYLARFGVEVAVRPFDAGASAFIDSPREMAKVETRRLGDMPVISALCEERNSRDWMGGYLAGMFDTDASYSGGSLRYCQSKQNDVLDRIVRYGKELGYEFQREDYEGGCPSARLMGGIAENIGFLSAISPALERRCRDFYGKRVATVDVPVVGMRRGPVMRLVDITTSTGTFIAEGALTHNCYAMTMAKRLKGMGSAKYQTDGDPRTSGPGFGVATHESALHLPLTWRKPRKVFVNSMSDLFHDEVSDEFIAKVFVVMALAPHHTFQVLTKRHARMRSLLNSRRWRDLLGEADSWSCGLDLPYPTERFLAVRSWIYGTGDWSSPVSPLPNCWLGVSVENQQWADIRIPALLDTPAAVRWISAEPLLGPVDLDGPIVNGHRPRLTYWLTGRPGWGPEETTPTGLVVQGLTTGPRIDWVVCGGESGPGARPMAPAWARTLRDQCVQAGVPYLFKQWGAHVPRCTLALCGTPCSCAGSNPTHPFAMQRVSKHAAGRELDGREWSGYPAVAS